MDVPDQIDGMDVDPLYLNPPAPIPWEIPTAYSVEYCRRLTVEADAVSVRPIADLSDMTPRALMESMRVVLGQSERVAVLALMASRCLTEIRGRLEKTRRYRQRLINKEMLSEEIRGYGFTSRPERLIAAEQYVEQIRQEVEQDIDLKTLRDHEIDLQHLESVWRDLCENLKSKQKLLRQADQLGKVAQRTMANHGSKILQANDHGAGPSSVLENMLREEEQQDAVEKESQ